MRPLLTLCGLLAALACAPAAAAAPGPALTVDAAADRRAISEDIYGMNFADPALAREIALPVDRWGGNTTDTYNWKVGAWNTGSDWFFENIPDCWDDDQCARGNGPREYVEHIDKARAAGAKTLLTLPMVGHVAKDAPTGGTLTCGFPRSRFPVQSAFDTPWHPNCGNGRVSLDPEVWVDDPVATDAGTPVGPAWSKEWIATDLRARGVRLYELGNEPMLWNHTHHAFHPDPVGYDELWQRSRDLAVAVKEADPAALTLGPSEWGWTHYLCSAADTAATGGVCRPDAPDRAAHGGLELTAWYLRRMREHEQRTGVRLLDYLDLHYYAQGGLGDPAITRSLWDPAYVDPSWIGERIELLPRMRRWIDEHYPGTRIALSEYDLTNNDNDGLVSTLVQADVLGIFAREGVDLATRWSAPRADQRQADAWRMFRSYDGAGGRFGSTWVWSRSADQDVVAVYGAQRADGALTVLAINKSAQARTSDVTLGGFAAGGPAQAWRWTGDGIRRVADVAAPEAFTADLPARSMTLYVVPARPVARPPDDRPGGGDEAPGGRDEAPAGGGGAGRSEPAPAPAAAPLPAAGRRVTPRARTCRVPRVTGRTPAAARRALRRAGCRAGTVRRRASRRGRRGRVVSQSVAAGRRVPATRAIALVVRR